MKKYIFFFSLCFLISIPLHGSQYPQHTIQHQPDLLPEQEAANSLEDFKDAYKTILKRTRIHVESLLENNQYEDISVCLTQAHQAMLDEKTKIINLMNEHLFKILSAEKQMLCRGAIRALMIEHGNYLKNLQSHADASKRSHDFKVRRNNRIKVNLFDPQVVALTGIVHVPPTPHALIPHAPQQN